MSQRRLFQHWKCQVLTISAALGDSGQGQADLAQTKYPAQA